MSAPIHPDLLPLTDVDEQFDAWGATCGPAAVAAALGLTRVADVRDAFAPFPGYTNITKLKSALRALDARVLRRWSKPDAKEKHDILTGPPARLVLMVQWSGPWNSIPRAAARHRHVVAYVRREDGCWVGDATVEGTWSPVEWWRDNIAKDLMPERADGKILATWAAQVEAKR